MGSVTCRLLWSPLFQTFINVNHTDIDREQKMRFWFHRCKKKHWCYHTYQENNYTFMRKEINDSEVNNNYGDILSFFFFSSNSSIQPHIISTFTFHRESGWEARRENHDFKGKDIQPVIFSISAFFFLHLL